MAQFFMDGNQRVRSGWRVLLFFLGYGFFSVLVTVPCVLILLLGIVACNLGIKPRNGHGSNGETLA